MRRRLVFLLTIISMIVICIPIYYITIYFTNKVTPFKDEITEFEKNGYVIENVNFDNFDKLNFKLVCKSFDIDNRYRATYTATIDTNVASISNIKMQISLCANWINFNEKSSTLSLNKTGNNGTVTINNLDKIVNRTNYFIPFPKPTAYVLLTYEARNNSKLEKFGYLVKFPYGSYKIEQGGFKN